MGKDKSVGFVSLHLALMSTACHQKDKSVRFVSLHLALMSTACNGKKTRVWGVHRYILALMPTACNGKRQERGLMKQEITVIEKPVSRSCAVNGPTIIMQYII